VVKWTKADKVKIKELLTNIKVSRSLSDTVRFESDIESYFSFYILPGGGFEAAVKDIDTLLYEPLGKDARQDIITKAGLDPGAFTFKTEAELTTHLEEQHRLIGKAKAQSRRKAKKIENALEEKKKPELVFKPLAKPKRPEPKESGTQKPVEAVILGMILAAGPKDLKAGQQKGRVEAVKKYLADMHLDVKQIEIIGSKDKDFLKHPRTKTLPTPAQRACGTKIAAKVSDTTGHLEYAIFVVPKELVLPILVRMKL
jgi:hypothetical protein